MQITKEMVTEFNLLLMKEGCIFRMEYGNSFVQSDMRIVVSNDKFIHSTIINPNDEFYSVLETFFKEKGIELNSNNTGNIFWSKHSLAESSNADL